MSTSQHRDEIERGERLYHNGNIKEALTAFESILKAEPANVLALNNKGVILNSLGRTREAIQTFWEVIRKGNRNSDGVFNLISTCLSLSKWEEAKNILVAYGHCLEPRDIEMIRMDLEKHKSTQESINHSESKRGQQMGIAQFSLYDPEEEEREKSERERIEELNHPERLAVLPYCVGTGIDVGCGNRKTADNCIGVDILAKGQIGEHGSVAGKESEADICAPGDDLSMFKDNELDYVIARHNIEHYVDVIKTLLEWKRVLKKGGIMAIVIPDETNVNTIALDPTHKHAFTPESFKGYIDLIGGFEIIKLEPVIENWSFMCACRKK